MAKETIVNLIDDLDGSPAVETVRFSFDGVDYEIDLSAKNAARLRANLTPYMEHGTRTDKRRGKTALTQVRRDLPAAQQTIVNRAIRDWALSKGYEVAERGRIKQTIVDAYHQQAGTQPSRRRRAQA